MYRSWIFGLIALFAATSVSARAERPLGESEVAAALSAIERRCPADVSNAASSAIRGMNEYVRQVGGTELPDAQTLGVAVAYRTLLDRNPQADESTLARAAVDSMISGVEPPPPEGAYVDTRVCDGCRAGIGLELITDGGHAIVVRPAPGSPAERAGLQAGDRIVTIDGANTAGWALNRIVRAFQGEVQSTVSITISRGAAPIPIELRLQREVIVLRSVEWRRDGDIGIISIHGFTEATGEKVRRAIRDLHRPAGYVLDLRGNTGGLLDQAIEVADLFLDGGVVVSVTSAHECPPTETATYHARRGDDARGAPLLVLVDGQTASGAELVAAALLDRTRAASVGQRTFGNGQVRTMIPISRRASIHLITGEMTSPSGRRLSEGLEPTHAAPGTTSDQDVTLQRAKEILRGG